MGLIGGAVSTPLQVLAVASSCSSYGMACEHQGTAAGARLRGEEGRCVWSCLKFAVLEEEGVLSLCHGA